MEIIIHNKEFSSEIEEVIKYLSEHTNLKYQLTTNILGETYGITELRLRDLHKITLYLNDYYCLRKVDKHTDGTTRKYLDIRVK